MSTVTLFISIALVGGTNEVERELCILNGWVEVWWKFFKHVLVMPTVALFICIALVGGANEVERDYQSEVGILSGWVDVWWKFFKTL